MRWLAFLLVALTAQAAAAPLVVENATVEGQTTRPQGVSGVLAICARFVIKTPQGERFPVYQIYLTEDQPLPKAGATCRIEYKLVPMRKCEVGLVPPAPEQLRDPHKDTIHLADHLSCSAYIP